MSSGEKILSSIRSDSEASIGKIKEESKEKCEKVLSKGRKKAQEITDAAEIKKAQQTERLTKANNSRTELEKRNMLLAAKRAEIDKAVKHIQNYMETLETKEYFELICRLASTLGNKEGIVFLNEKDLRRAPKDLEKRLNESGIKATLSKTPYNKINSGFILKNGDIEDNMSFDAIIAEHREAIEDLINRELFKK